MNLNRRHALAAGAALAFTTALWRPAGALGVEQPRILYGFPPGSAGDVAAHQVAGHLGGTRYARLPAVVDNRAGAGGRIALEALRDAPADDSVLALTPMSTLSIYPHVYRRLP